MIMAISLAVKKKICDQYNSGNSIQKISNLVNVSTVTISKILKAYGIIIRKDNYQQIDVDVHQLNKLYDEGQSIQNLATQFGISGETVRKHIKNIRPASAGHKESTKMKISQRSKSNWKDPEYQDKVTKGKTPSHYSKLSEAGKRNYHLTLGKWINNDGNRRILSDIAKLLWQDPDYRAKQQVYFQERGIRLAEASKNALANKDKRESWIDKIKRNNADRIDGGWVSTTQKQFYYLLEQSNIHFIPEGVHTKISPFYVVDCIIPIQHSMVRPLIVEINGEYWHSLPHVALKDRQKSTYIKNNTDYDLLSIDELEMSNFDQVLSKLNTFGLNVVGTNCTVRDIIIRQIDEQEAKYFYSIFHYSSTVRKGAITYGAYYQDKLIGAISYTYPLRKSSATRLGYDLCQVMEISRMARRTDLICKNFLSWFISKTMNKLDRDIKCVLSFSDSTYGHTGGVYKAANFINDGKIDPDYSYVATAGRYHKKTIWDRAKRMKMTEKDYADKHNLIKVYGGPKTRWLFYR